MNARAACLTRYNHFAMLETTLTLQTITLEAPGLRGATLTCPRGLLPAPGQYWLAHAPALDEPLPIALFAAKITPDGVHIAPLLPDGWMAGMQIAVRGPQGKGFRLPELTRRVALVALDAAPHRLLPLMDLALRQGAAVTLYASLIPRNLPDAVEALPLDMASEARGWADYLALDVPLSKLAQIPARLGLKPFEPLGCPAQALIHTAMPCGGNAECGVCAVPFGRGWKLACKDGPVFDLKPLLEG